MDRASLAEIARDTKTITVPLFLGSEHVGLNKQSSNTSLGFAKICSDNHKGAAPEKAWRAAGAGAGQFSRIACG